MACEHAETTTLLWLYGEGDDRIAAHVAGCADCQAVVATHEGVATSLGPAMAGLGRPSVAVPQERPAVRRFPWGWIAVPIALAAACLLWLRPVAPPEPTVAPEAAIALAMDTDAPREPDVFGSLSADLFDAELDDLDLELDRLSLDLGVL